MNVPIQFGVSCIFLFAFKQYKFVKELSIKVNGGTRLKSKIPNEMLNFTERMNNYSLFLFSEKFVLPPFRGYVEFSTVLLHW